MDIDNNVLEQGKKVFDSLCNALDNRGWKYRTDEEQLQVFLNAVGEDLQINFLFKVNLKKQILSVYSRLPFAIDEDRREEVALALSYVNYILADGSFDFNILTGNVLFRMTASFKETSLSEKLLDYLVVTTCGTVDDYNDKILDLNNKKITLAQFIEIVDA